MAFTYDGTLDSDLEKARLLIGDTDSTKAQFQDAEITYFLDLEGNVQDAAAAACEALATKYSRRADFSIDGQLVKASQVARAYANRARELRETAPNSINEFMVERIDGYTEGIANDSNERGQPLTDVYSGNDFDAGRMWP